MTTERDPNDVKYSIALMWLCGFVVACFSLVIIIERIVDANVHGTEVEACTKAEDVLKCLEKIK